MSAQHNPASVEAILDALRRGQRQFAKNPRRAVENAVTQLLHVGRAPAHARPRSATTQDSPEAPVTYRIDDLARASGVTVHNIRAYQERGLLPPPHRRGRVAIFDDGHLSRLRIITSMLDRGYTSTHILEMLRAWEEGRDLADVLGLERALVVPSLDDPPKSLSVTDARTRVGGAEDFDKLVAAGLIEVKGSQARLLRPKLLDAFDEMRGYGVTLERLITVHLDVAEKMDQITTVLVDAGLEQLGERFLTQTSNTQDVEAMVGLLTRFRAVTMTSATATLSASLDKRIEGLLADYLSAYLNERDAG